MCERLLIVEDITQVNVKIGIILVIVESPAKAKTINKYLGKEYIVKSTIGHIRDLPTSGSINQKSITVTKKKKSKFDSKYAFVNQIGIDPYNDWEACYKILPNKEKIVKELKTLAEKADHIYLATDPDREGEAIAWHLQEVIGGNNTRFSRVVFNEISRNAIHQAFKQPGELNINWVNAQKTRRFIDRIVGYLLSPLLCKKIARSLSAGRVQSVAVRLIVEREQEIKAFVPKERWELYVSLQTDQAFPLAMQVTRQHEKPFKPFNQQHIKDALGRLENVKYVISNRDDRLISSKPEAPFTTSTLQQAANIRLGYSVKKTMMLAQRLYEMGHITYIRTDSTNLSQDAINMARDYISTLFGNLYIPKQPNEYSSKNNVLKVHEAIRPSDVNILAEQLKNVEADAQKLYQLIWNQFIACQMTPAQYTSTKLTVIAGEFQLCSRWSTLHFDGWTKVMLTTRKSDEDWTSPEVKIGDILTLSKFLPRQNFTKPPARYNEASLVKELEKRGIGRPSTYVSIISTIQDRGYVYVNNCHFYAKKIGEIVTDRLKENFYELMNYDFTANMENTLDQVAANQKEWKRVLNTFFYKFSKQLENAKRDPKDGGMRTNQMVTISIYCPVCNRKMGIRTVSTGIFLCCSGYILSPKERCKNTINLIPEMKISNMLKGDNAESNALQMQQRCEKCNVIMDSYVIDNKRRLHVCGNNPLCDGYNIEQGDFLIKKYDSLMAECKKCGNNMHIKFGRFGKYMACANDNCKIPEKF